MKKDSYYFPHFEAARNDRKILRLRKDLGTDGYAAYFMLLEVLRSQTDFCYPFEDVDLLADDFKISEAIIKTTISNYGLFEVDIDKNIFSPKFNEFMEPYLRMKNQRIEAGKKSVEARKRKALNLNERKTTVERPLNERKTTVEATVKQSKEKKRKENTIAHFDNASASTCFSFNEFWGAYEKKKDRYKAEKIYNKLPEQDRQVIKDTIALYVQSTPEIKFRKFPCTYLNNRSWEDEIINYDSKPQQEVFKRTVRTLND